MTPAEAAAEVLAVIEEYGEEVTLPSGATVKAIVDDNPERIAREMPLELDGRVQGRPALFDFAPGTNVKANDLVTYDGQAWTMHPARKVKSQGTTVRLTFLGTSGAIR